ncbi:MAG TPA: acetylornithine deacetylase [Pseudolabrys sp.]|nr:acetylornithine deacetylase [Pseudolabrys sp.]
MTPEEILALLVSFPSVAGEPNGDIAAWIRDYAAANGARVSAVPGPEGDRVNLLITMGPKNVPGIILSGHMDVVPAGEAGWTSGPFTLMQRDDRLYGRGATDMKGFLACALAALPALAERKLARPVHLAFSYDEEAGCRGVPHLIAALPQLCAKPDGCIVGEPSGMRAILAHKGKAATRVSVRGISGHSSRPDLGRNAIHAMTVVLATAVQTSEALKTGPFDTRFAPPYSTLQVGTIEGGRAVNIVPDLCVAELEVRAVTGVAPQDALAPVRAAVDGLKAGGFDAEWQILSAYPALSLDTDAPLAGLMRTITGEETIDAVSYGTEAGLYQAAGIDAIICGPGDIARAHRADEYIHRDELAACSRMIARLGDHCAA